VKSRKPFHVIAATTAAVVALAGVTVAAQADESEPAAASTPVFFVHGYNDNENSDCASLWGNALDYFEAQGRDRSSMKTVGYYGGDTNCDTDLGDGSTDTRIKRVAAEFANYIYDNHTSKDQSVDVVAHSMGGLVTRVAMLGSAKGWEGFPKAKLKVGDIATLATPHQGIIEPEKYQSTQWDSMIPGSTFLETLQAPENQLDQEWASGTDWSFVGSQEDQTVYYGSGIDKDRHADHKYGYLPDADYDISHTNIRQLAPGGAKFNLRYWHASEGVSHDTTDGWAPLETAYNAVDRNGDW